MANDTQYRVVFDGETRLGFIKEDVVDSLAELFKTTPEKVTHYVCGEQRALAKHYDKTQAEKIAQLIEDAGAKVQVLSDAQWQEVSAQKQSKQEQPQAYRETDREDNNRPNNASGDNHDTDIDQSDIAHEEYDSYRYDADIEQDFSAADKNANLESFVQKNWKYYQSRFAIFEGGANARLKLSWHWPGFFVFFFWACYRKMWLPAAIYLVLSVLVNVVLMSNLGFLLLHLGGGLTANFIYYRHAHKQIDRYGSDNISLQRVGGVSSLALVGSILCVFFLYNYIGNMYLQRIVDQNQEQFESFVPGSGSQLLGDQPIVTLDGLSEAQKLTLSRINQSAMRLKVFELFLVSDNNPEALSMMALDVDAWGNEIQFRKSEDGVYELRSAGEDGQMNTLDDIIQPYKLKRNQE